MFVSSLDRVVVILPGEYAACDAISCCIGTDWYGDWLFQVTGTLAL